MRQRRSALDEHSRRRNNGIQVAAHARAKRLQCPGCGRKSALREQVDPMGVFRQCRWCKWADGHAWEQLGLDGPPRNAVERFMGLANLYLGRTNPAPWETPLPTKSG